MRKIHVYKDYMLDYLLMQYGLRTIAQNTLDYIVKVTNQKTSSYYIETT